MRWVEAATLGRQKIRTTNFVALPLHQPESTKQGVTWRAPKTGGRLRKHDDDVQEIMLSCSFDSLDTMAGAGGVPGRSGLEYRVVRG